MLATADREPRPGDGQGSRHGERLATGKGKVRHHAKASTTGSNLRRTGVTRFAFLCLSLALLLAALFAASAQAAPVTIAEWGQGAGRVNLPQGVAVDQSSGDLYVAERNNFRVSKFDSGGKFLLAFGYGVADGVTPELQTCGPEASPPTARCFNGNFSSSDAGLAAISVAVDQSSGDVYVGDGDFRVSKFTPSGQPIFMVGKDVNETKVAEGGATQAEKDICTAASGDTCGRGSSGTGPNEFSNSGGLSPAVDSSGVVWVGDTNRLISFSSAGAPDTAIALAGAGNTDSLALDSSGDFYIKSGSFAGIRKLEAGTGTLLETLDAASNPRTVTVDGGDDVYIGHCVVSTFCGESPYRFDAFNPAGEKISQFGEGQVIGEPEGNAIAIDDGSGRLYSASSEGAFDFNPPATKAEVVVQAFPLPEPGPLPEDQHVTDLEPTGATLVAELNPEGHETTYHFEWGTSEGYGHSTPTETLTGEEFDSEAVEAGLEGLIASTTYHFRLCATNEVATVCSPDTTFTTLPAVAVDAQWASDVAAHSASLHAEMNPLGFEGTWWIEYGTSAAYGQSIAKAALPASFGDISVGALLSGLDPATTYHYRFAAHDERDGAPYTVHGEDRTFITQLAGLGFSLADRRAWEMVSPPQKHGALLVALNSFQGGHIQGAADGEALAYLSMNSVQEDPEGSRTIEETSTLAQRGPGGWSSTDLSPPRTEIVPPSIGWGLEYKLFSTNLERALLEPRDATPLSPAASERTPYLRRNTEPPIYVPLVTGCPAEPEPCPAAVQEAANVPAGTEFNQLGPEAQAAELILGNVRVSGASPDLDHVVLNSSVPLAEGISGGAMYEWTAGRLAPVSVKPAGEGGATVPALFGSGEHSTRHAISGDGSRVFWSVGSNALYLRDVAREETVRLDVVQPGAYGTNSSSPIFQGANAAGTVAFFTDTQNLTQDANQSGADLYRCQVTVEAGELSCQLTDLTANGGESAEVQGIVAGMGDDGTRVYFVAGGALDAEPNEYGESAASGQPNLYLWQQGAGIRYIATLSAEDHHDWGGLNTGAAKERTATASPSGRYLAFMSERSLSGYDNRDTVSGESDQEVFRYDAAADELNCASCNPSGARPAGVVGGSESFLRYYDGQKIWDGRAVAAIVPEATSLSGVNTSSLYRPRYVQDDGRVFFNAADSLVPADSNGGWDVYEYEPAGAGSCTASSGGAATSLAPEGCLSLLSSGTGEGEAGFIDASEGGSDAFFFSPAQLSVTDEDQEIDIYDARVDGVQARLKPNAECLGEACQPAVNPPDEQTPASAVFRGAGNLRPQAGCGAIARRPGKLSHPARRLRRHAKRFHDPNAARRMRSKAQGLARRAHSPAKGAKRCRHTHRRGGR